MSTTSSRVNVGILLLFGVFSFSTALTAQTRAMPKTINILVQALDGRNGKPLAHQHLLVFTGLSSDAVKSHAEHSGLTTDKKGIGTLTIYSAETQWMQVWADGRILCQQDPNQNTFSIATIMSKGLATPNTCSGVVQEPTPGRLIVYARPAHFAEMAKQ